jgi:hypothetical protein
MAYRLFGLSERAYPFRRAYISTEIEVHAPTAASRNRKALALVSVPPTDTGSSAAIRCRPATISCANPAALPRTTKFLFHSFRLFQPFPDVHRQCKPPVAGFVHYASTAKRNPYLYRRSLARRSPPADHSLRLYDCLVNTL